MINTPLITKLGKKGTFITFPSASEDLTLSAFNNSNVKFNFSKFIMLEIPPIQESAGNNNIQFENIEGHFTKGLSVASPPPEGDRFDFVESFQNYALNLETLLTKQPNYNSDNTLNVSERVFWKWLKEIGAIRFRDSTSDESLVENRYVEEDDSSLYNRVVKFIGEISQENNYRNEFNAFKEILMTLPTQCGDTPVCLFKTISDENYHPSKFIQQTGSDNIEFIQGQSSSNNPSNAGLDVRAFYDMDVPTGSYDYTSNGTPNEYWFKDQSVNGENAYYTDIDFNDSSNDEINRTDSGSGKTIDYVRNRLDGISIEFDTSSYKDFQDFGNLLNFYDYAALDKSKDYEFNAILIYYELFDENRPEDGSTHNLFGILFLEDLESFSTAAAKIPTITKVKPDPLLKKNGTSYGVRLSLKFDVNADNVIPDVEVNVNDYNTFSTQLFAEAVTKISALTRNVERLILENNEMRERINQLELTNQSLVNNGMQQQINSILESILEVGEVDFSGKIDEITTKINEILSGQTSVSIDSLFNIIGIRGISVNNDGNNIVISNTRQRYSSVINTKFNISGSESSRLNSYNLGIYDTLILHNDDQTRIMKQNLVLFIDDTTNRWNNGQILSIKINEKIDFNNFGLIIYTDKPNRFSLPSNYSKRVVAIQYNELNGIEKPEIIITCTNNIDLKFIYSII